jgi:hypothetical protein
MPDAAAVARALSARFLTLLARKGAGAVERGSLEIRLHPPRPVSSCVEV